jgi:hypothetical protein
MPMNPRLLRPLATGFNPKSIAGLGLWLDASDGSTISIETGVSQWRDKSGNGRNFAQSIGNNQPAVTANGQNNRNTLKFDGSNDSLTGPAGFSLTNTHSVIAVVRPDVRKIAGLLAGSVTNSNLIYGDGSSSFSGTKFGAFGVARAVYGGGTITTGSFQVFAAVLSGGTLPTDLSMFTNGTGGVATVETAGTAPGAALTASLLIGTTLGNQFWNGDIAEMLIWTRALSTAERSLVERALGKKWAITVA